MNEPNSNASSTSCAPPCRVPRRLPSRSRHPVLGLALVTRAATSTTAAACTATRTAAPCELRQTLRIGAAEQLDLCAPARERAEHRHVALQVERHRADAHLGGPAGVTEPRALSEQLLHLRGAVKTKTERRKAR